MKIREANRSDAADLTQPFTKLDTETDYMLFEPGERRTTFAEQEAILDSFTRDVGAHKTRLSDGSLM